MPTIPLAYALVGLVLTGLSVPLVLGKVPPNTWYGFRTRLTLQDPEIWYPVNAWASRRLLVIGLATFVAALAGPLVPRSLLDWYYVLLALLLMLGLGLLLVLGCRYARRLARR
jgi:hypothetical protein